MHARPRQARLRLAVMVLTATACPREDQVPAAMPPVSQGPSGAPEPSAVERCLAAADAARAAGRPDLVADALGGAAQLEPNASRRLAWAQALAQVDPRKARAVARSLASAGDASVRAEALALSAGEPPSPPPPDRELADRLLAAHAAGRNDDVLRELLPRAESLSDDMLFRLAGALARAGDLQAAARVWGRVRVAHDAGDGWSLVQGGPFAIRSIKAGANALTLITSGPARSGERLVHVQLHDGTPWSSWSMLPGAAGIDWLGPRREVLTWNIVSLELRDADSGAIVATRRFPVDDDLRGVGVAPGVGLAALVRSGAVEIVDASLVARTTHPIETGDVVAMALAPSGTRVALFDRRGAARVLDATTGQIRRLPPLGTAVVQAVWRPDGRLVVIDDHGVARWHNHGRWMALTRGDRSPVLATAVAPNGAHVAVADPQGLTLIDPAGRATRRHERAWRGRAIHLDFSPDGGALVAIDEEAVVRQRVPDLAVESRWELAGTRFRASDSREMVAAVLDLEPGGRRLYAARPDRSLTVWDLEARSGEVTKIAWPDSRGPMPGELIYAFSENGTALALSRLGAANVALVRDGHFVRALSLGEDGPRVLALAVNDAADRTIVATGESLHLYDARSSPVALAGGILRPKRMAFDEDERRLQIFDENGYLVVWELATGAKLGLHGPADDLGVLDRDGTKIAYWSGSTLSIAPLAGELPEAQQFQPCGPGCEFEAAAFTDDGAGVEWVARVGGAERFAQLELRTGDVKQLSVEASRLTQPGRVHRQSSVTNALDVWRRGHGRVVTVAVAGDLTEWAATTPAGTVDGHVVRPWAFALRGADGVLHDLEPFMLTARAAGMIPAMLARGVPPACSAMPRGP